MEILRNQIKVGFRWDIGLGGRWYNEVTKIIKENKNQIWVEFKTDPELNQMGFMIFDFDENNKYAGGLRSYSNDDIEFEMMSFHFKG